MKTSDEMLTSFDASPWGLGAVIYIGGVPVSFFASALSSADEKQYKVVIGDHKAQQLWESLTILVALRTWRTHWTSCKMSLGFKGDHVTALTMILRMQAPAGNIKAVAKEIAIELTRAVFKPKFAKHVPGLANTVSDRLSRKFEPGRGQWRMPEELVGVPEAFPPVRNSSYYTIEHCPRMQVGSERQR